ncbi:MAG: hypothetical protein MUC57_20430 [Desulfobacterales bacterium]|nr:hypothetical protein [Desulfobacterales bacterium]
MPNVILKMALSPITTACGSGLMVRTRMKYSPAARVPGIGQLTFPSFSVSAAITRTSGSLRREPALRRLTVTRFGMIPDVVQVIEWVVPLRHSSPAVGEVTVISWPDRTVLMASKARLAIRNDIFMLSYPLRCAPC